MKSRQCGQCFAIAQAEGACSRCGSPPPAKLQEFDASILLDLSPLEAPESPQWSPRPQESLPREHAFVGMLRQGLVMLAIATIGLLALDFLYGANTAAQASWTAQSQIGGQRDARRAELRQGVDDLQALHKDLVSSYGTQKIGASARVAWSLRWRESLAEIPVSYRQHAPIAMAPINVRAEENLRKARIYLSSLEGAMAKGLNPIELRNLERSFLEALEAARSLVY